MFANFLPRPADNESRYSACARCINGRRIGCASGGGVAWRAGARRARYGTAWQMTRGGFAEFIPASSNRGGEFDMHHSANLSRGLACMRPRLHRSAMAPRSREGVRPASLAARNAKLVCLGWLTLGLIDMRYPRHSVCTGWQAAQTAKSTSPQKKKTGLSFGDLNRNSMGTTGVTAS